MTTTSFIPPGIRRDAIVVALFLVAAVVLGSGYARALRNAPNRAAMPGLSQRIFGAALMSACGRGLTTPSALLPGGSPPDAASAVASFLSQRREALRCEEIPADLHGDGLDGPQRASRYLILTVAAAWTLGGPDWAGIDRLLGLMFAASIVFAYLACRFSMGRLAAIVVATLVMISPLHLDNLIDVRDYSKAPFFFASLCAVAMVVTRAWQPAMLVIQGALVGAVLGFGFGMRTDVIVNLMMMVGALLAFLPHGFVQTWRIRFAAAAACIVMFALVAAPLMQSFETRSSLWHWALLGYAHDSDRALDIIAAPYEAGSLYSDSYVATTVDAYWGRVTGADKQVSVGLDGYAEASRGYYFATLATFPADAVLRGWASVIKILELPFSGAGAVRADLLPAMLARTMAIAQRVLVRFEDYGVAIFLVVILAVSVHSIRLAVLLAGLAVLLGAYPAIQFQRRHVFHLEVLSFWTLAFALSSVFGLITGPAAARAGWTRARLWRPAVFGLALALLVLMPLGSLRAYQRDTAAALLASYDEAAVMPIAWAGHTLSETRGPRSMYADMLVVDVSAGCGADRVPLTFRYVARPGSDDFSRTYDIDKPPAGQPTKVFFPVYETGTGNPAAGALRFSGLEVPPAAAACVSSVSRFVDPDRFPLLLPAVLAGDWRTLPLHQQLRRWESPPALADARRVAANPDVPRFSGDVEYQAPIVRVGEGAAVEVDGFADASGSYLVAWRAQAFDDSRVLAIDGHLDRGGVTLGLVDETGWATRVEIDTPGAFAAEIRAPRPGSYQLVIANALRDSARRNQFTILRIADARAAQ